MTELLYDVKNMPGIDLIIDFHKKGDRQGPGGVIETKRAIDLTGVSKVDSLNIADIGCGTGGQTLTLAENTSGNITAIDLFPQFLEKLKIKIEERNFQKRVKTKVCSMDCLPFADEELDLIWSEGAIYNIGFERGIREWKRFLKPRGYLAVSEMSWIVERRPDEVEKYFSNAYPAINTISAVTRLLEKNGYAPVVHFVLPESCWLDTYYGPIKNRIPEFLAEYPDNQAAMDMISEVEEDIRIYETYKDYYGYVFYIAQKRA